MKQMFIIRLLPATLCCAAIFIQLSVITIILDKAEASSSHSVMKTIETADSAYNNESLAKIPPPEAKSVLARERNQGKPFRVLARKQNIERFKCSTCHTNKEISVKKGAELTHGSISLTHGKTGALNCIDCHSETNRDFLEDKKGNKIDFDHSYQLCGQCHFRQKSDWLGGAHGKRLKNWAGERIIFNCTNCHNPHSPRFEKRFPVIYSTPKP